MSFKPSKYQQAVYDFIQKGEGNAVVEAVAGSGKTTTIVNALELIPKNKKIIFCAFTNTIVKELSERVPKHVETTTIHSMGWRSAKKYYGNVQIDSNKAFSAADTLLSPLFPQSKVGQKWSYLKDVVKLIDLMRMDLCFSEKEVEELCEKHDIELYPDFDLIGDSRRVLKFMMKSTKTFDFADMLFYTAINKDIHVETFDWVFVDECQDLNRAQLEIMKRLIKPKTGRFVAVGDRLQCIYGFAGSDIESFNNLVSMPSTITLPLSVSYRCGKNIIKHVQDINPSIEFFNDSEDGEVIQDGSYRDAKDGDWILCRNVKPLVMLCLKYIKEGKKAIVKGEDIGKSMVNLLKKTKQNNKKMAFLILDQQLIAIKQRLAKNGVSDVEGNPLVVSIKEKIDVIRYIGQDCEDVNCIIKYLEAMFKNDNIVGITLCSMHRSKGLEADNVFIICRDLLPSKYAKKEWQLEQERNLEYVAYTRAKKRLIFDVDFEADFEKK